MKHYFKNLLAAVCGNNPYRNELDKAREEMEKACENVRMLQESYYSASGKAAEAERMLSEYKGLLEKSEKQTVSYQALVENQRERIHEYQRRIEEYNKEIDAMMRELRTEKPAACPSATGESGGRK